jgi:cyclophilin family peptidyl-prolyl cis-trans isomerase
MVKQSSLTTQNRLIISGLIFSTILIVAIAFFAIINIQKRLNEGYHNFGQVVSKMLAIEYIEIDKKYSDEEIHSVLKDYTDAIVSAHSDIVFIEFKDANDKVVTMGYKEIASVLANMDAADQYKGAGEEYKQLWQQIEDKRGKAFADSLKEFYSSGNLENLSKSQVDQLKE